MIKSLIIDCGGSGPTVVDSALLVHRIHACGFSPSLRHYISISNLGFSPLYMINVYGTNPTTQKTE